MPVRVADVGEQVQHLGLDRHVERGDRLVQDQHLRLGRERPGDRDPLALPARQRAAAARASGARPGRPGRPAPATRLAALVGSSRRDAAAAPRRSRRAPSGAGRGWSTGPGRRSAPRRPRRRRSRADARRAWSGRGRRRGSCPPSARSRPTIMRATVVLPEPDSPTTASDRPGSTRERHVVDGDQLGRTPCAGPRPRRATGSAMRTAAQRRRRQLLGAHAAHDAAPASAAARGRVARQRSCDVQAAGRNAQPAGASKADSGPAGDRGQALARWRRCAAGPPASAAVYGCSGSSCSARSGCVSTICPAYMTAVRSQTALASSRSWVMNSSARPQLAAQLVEDRHHLGLGGHVERGGGLVGQEQPRLGQQRGGDHDALQHAARQLVRVLAQPPLAVVDADLVEQLRRPACGLGAAHAADGRAAPRS